MARLPHVSDPMLADAQHLAALLPDGVCLLIAEARHEEVELHPLERAYLNERTMQPVREREFRIGRALAREALTQFGVTGHPLLPAATREPQWPAGIVGSISHGSGVCAVAIAERRRFSGLGIDFEAIGRIDNSIAATVCTPGELAETTDVQQLSLRFSAKESVFKTLFPLTRHFLDFHDVTLLIEDGRFTARPARAGLPADPIEALRGRFRIGTHLVVTAAWLPAP
jgi:4'-phosphopantetheinyl transferase EntD